jgi:hypothetical protein
LTAPSERLTELAATALSKDSVTSSAGKSWLAQKTELHAWEKRRPVRQGHRAADRMSDLAADEWTGRLAWRSTTPAAVPSEL